MKKRASVDCFFFIKLNLTQNQIRKKKQNKKMNKNKPNKIKMDENKTNSINQNKIKP